MANILNKIHYGVMIQTKSPLTSESIGLHSGTLYYASDNYSPTSTDTWDTEWTDRIVAEPHELQWNTDLLETKGLSTLSSDINIIEGGLYAYLKNCSVKLVNKTSIGNTIHKTMESLLDFTVLGAKMTVFIIFDGVWYPRWTGVVGAKSFSETTYTFLGHDDKSNTTDTIEGLVVGLINADIDYKPLGELNLQLMTSYRINKSVDKYDNVKSWIGSDKYSDQIMSPLQSFTGFGCYSKSYMWDVETDITLSLIMPTETVEIGDMLQFHNSKKVYVITMVQGYSPVGKQPYLNLHLEALDNTILDYSFLFNDKDNNFHGSVHPVLDTLASPEDGTKCFFSLFHKATEGTIDPSSVIGNKITCINDGVPYEFEVMDNGDGGIVIKQPSSSNKIMPIKVQHFYQSNNNFDNNAGRPWADFENTINDPAQTTDITDLIPNDFEPTSPFYKIGGANIGQTINTESYQYFMLTFNKEDLKDRTDLQLGVMLKGCFDHDNQAWEDENLGSYDGWMYYMSQHLYSDGSTPTYPTTNVFTNVYAMAASTPQNYMVSTYNIVTDNAYGRIPLKSGTDIVLPNFLDNMNTVVEDGTTQAQRSFVSNSIPVTNTPDYRDSVQSTFDTILGVGIEGDSGADADTTFEPYAIGAIRTGNPADEEVELYDQDYVDILVCVNSFNTTGDIDYNHINTAGDSTELTVEDGNTWVGSLDSGTLSTAFMLNGFCLFDTYSTNEAEMNIEYKTEDIDDDFTYIELLKTLSQNGGNYDLVGDYKANWMAGAHIKEQEQRYGVIHKLCMQGFTGGFTNRYGIDTYTDIGVSHSPKTINDSIIIADTIKAFKSSSPALIYNEFNIITNNNDDIIIKNTHESDFPIYGEDYSEYVTGYDDYYRAKNVWEEARKAFLVTNIIHRAPTSRTTLEFASSNIKHLVLNDTPLSIETTGSYESWHDGDIKVGAIVSADNEILYNATEIGDVVHFANATEWMIGRVYFKEQIGGAFYVRWTVQETNIPVSIHTWYGDLSLSFISTTESNVYRDEYLDKLLQWTSYPKLQVSFKVPITIQSLRYELLDSIHFNDPIITPDLGEYGLGWITKYALMGDSIELQITFEPKFHIIPCYSTPTCNFINEDEANTDFIIEDDTNTDYINEEVC